MHPLYLILCHEDGLERRGSLQSSVCQPHPRARSSRSIAAKQSKLSLAGIRARPRSGRGLEAIEEEGEGEKISPANPIPTKAPYETHEVLHPHLRKSID